MITTDIKLDIAKVVKKFCQFQAFDRQTNIVIHENELNVFLFSFIKPIPLCQTHSNNVARYTAFYSVSLNYVEKLIAS